MSIALFGLSGDVVASSAPDTSLPIRELVLQDIEAWLRTIKAYAPDLAQADVENTSEADFVPGGTYAGTVTRCYRVEVVTGGVSGVAAVTVTDATPADVSARWPLQDPASANTADDGPTAEVVTSGVAIDLGDAGLGATLTLTFSGALVAGDVWYVWAGPYQVSVDEVTRSMDRVPANIGIELQVPVESPDDAPITKEQNAAVVVLSCFVPPSSAQPTEIEKLLAAVKKSMRIDNTRGGHAIETAFEGNAGFALSDLKTRGGFDLNVLVTYRHDEDDPLTL